MRRLSKSVAELKLRYDVVVVGSGYGGGVAASRMARAGKKVAVLERGQEFAIGDFPDRMIEAQEQFQVSQDGRRVSGQPTGLYDLRLGKDIHVFVGCGLGGGSLINANVSLPPDPRVWDDPVWPPEIKQDQLRQEGFTRAMEVLRPVPYQGPALDKLNALGVSGNALRKDVVRPPINVTFEKQVNYAGVEQPACTLCGDCCSGCNVGSKNTVQVTYLADAFHHGAEIFTEMRVSHVRQERGRWRVFFEPLGHEREKFAAADQSITCDVVVLAAGTLGSTEILLRSREEGLPVSDQVGERFTGNGDVLAFAYNNDVPVNGIGVGEPPAVETGPVGPCITGLIDLRDTPKLEDGMVIEEGSIPSALAPILPALLATGGDKFGEDTDRGIIDLIGERARRRQSLLFGAYQGAANRTQTYLVMSHDDGKGRMSLDEGRLKLSWPKVAAQPIFEKVGSQPAPGDAGNGRHLHAQSAHRHAVRPQPHIRASSRRLRDGSRPRVRRRQSQVPGVRWARRCRRRRCARRALCVRRFRHSPAARRQPAADHHGAGRARHDPSRQGPRLAFLRNAEVRLTDAHSGPWRPRDP